MALFGRKPPELPEEPVIDPEAERLRRDWEKLDKHLTENPLFAVITFDKLNWVEPFSGAIVPTPFGRLTEARKYYANNEHWRRSRTKPMAELDRIRWLHWIRDNIRSDERLRIFNAQGIWLNPYTGTWAPSVARQGGKVNPEVLQGMANELQRSGAGSPEDLRSLPDLRECCGAHREEESSIHPIIGDEGFSATITQATDSAEGPIAPTGQARITKQRAQSASDSDITRLRELVEAAPEAPGEGSGSRELAASEDLERARRVQQNMLSKIPEIPGYRIAIHYQPYDAIGGDFYEIRHLSDDRVLILMGDVTGHGVQAALVTSSMIKSLRYITRVESDLVEILAQLNDSAREDLISGQFVTMWAAILDVPNRVIETVCAGHHPALLGNADKDVVLERIGNRGMAVGLMSSTIMRQKLETTHYQLEPGDLLFQYTDGLSEMQHAERGEFGDLRAMGALVAHLEEEDPQAIIDGIAAQARSFAGREHDDDVTMLAIRLEQDDP